MRPRGLESCPGGGGAAGSPEPVASAGPGEAPLALRGLTARTLLLASSGQVPPRPTHPVIRAANEPHTRESTGEQGELVHACRTEGTGKVEGGALGQRTGLEERQTSGAGQGGCRVQLGSKIIPSKSSYAMNFNVSLSRGVRRSRVTGGTPRSAVSGRGARHVSFPAGGRPSLAPVPPSSQLLSSKQRTGALPVCVLRTFL